MFNFFKKKKKDNEKEHIDYRDIAYNYYGIKYIKGKEALLSINKKDFSDIEYYSKLYNENVIENSAIDSIFLEELYDELAGYRRLSGSSDTSHITKSEIARLYSIRISRALYRASPTYNNLVDSIVDKYVAVFPKITVKTDSKIQRKALQYIVDTQLEVLNFPFLIERCLKQLLIDGELFLYIKHDKKTDALSIDNIDPLTVNNVIYDESGINPLQIKFYQFDKNNIPILRSEYIYKKYQNGNGNIIYISVNNLLGGRGRPFYETVMDWCYKLDSVMLTRAEFWRWQGGILFDVTIEDASAEDIVQKANELKYNPPSPTSILLHNQKEKWGAPLIERGSRANIIEIDINNFLRQIKYGSKLGFSPFFEGFDNLDDETGNRLLYVYNRVFVPAIQMIVSYIIDKYKDSNKSIYYNISIDSVITNTAITKTNSVALQQTVAALEAARKQGIITRDSSIEVIYNILQKEIPNKDNKVEYADITAVNSFINTIANAIYTGLLSEDDGKAIISNFFNNTDIPVVLKGAGVESIKLKKSLKEDENPNA